MEHIFTTNGAVEPEELKKEEDSLRQKIFNIGDPLTILFHEVEEIQDLVTASGNPFSPVQQLTIRIKLIKISMISIQALHHDSTCLRSIKLGHDSKHMLNLQEYLYAASEVQLCGIQHIINRPI